MRLENVEEENADSVHFGVYFNRSKKHSLFFSFFFFFSFFLLHLPELCFSGDAFVE